MVKKNKSKIKIFNDSKKAISNSDVVFADKFIGITHKFDWAVIRQIDAANEVSYDCK